MTSTTTATDLAADEHLAKFPPFEGAKLGGDFKVDENVVKALPIPGTKVRHAARYGNSLWGMTAKIDCNTPDGKSVSYFHKAIKHEESARMIEADFESLKALHGVKPNFVPKPYKWGQYKDDPTCHFMVVEFREVADGLPPPVPFTQAVADLHLSSESPTGKFGFHMKTMTGPIPQQNDEWSDSWEEVFGRMLGNLLDLDGERNPPWPEFEHIKHLMKTRIIPRLLQPLQSEGRNIKPCLVHGDLWDGNTAIDADTGDPFIFDPVSFYAHNEYETGNWRAPRHRLSSALYVGQYQKFFPKSEPVDDWDSRNILYSLPYNTNAAILYPHMNQREAIYKDMEELCRRLCPDELAARLKPDTAPKQINTARDSDEDSISEEEELDALDE